METLITPCSDERNETESFEKKEKYFEGKVIACGGLHVPEKAENLLKNKEADLAAVGKGAIANPNLPKDIQLGRSINEFVPEMIRPLATIENTRNWRKSSI